MVVELVLKAGFVALASAGLAAGLAWSSATAGRTRPWPVTGSLLLGPDGDRDDEVDLRFRAFAAGALLVVLWALAFPEALRGAGVVRLALGLGLVLPLVTLALSAAADLAARVVAARRPRVTLTVRSASRAQGADLDASAGASAEGSGADDDAPLDDLVEEARLELREASSRVSGAHLRAAIEALRDALDDYALAEPDDETRERVRGVTALARTCVEAEGQEAVRLLGVRADADADEVATVCRALLPLYRGPAALPGVDPARAAALERAAAKLTRRAA